MATTTETGINTYVKNFNELIGICNTFGPSYKPQNARFAITALQEQSAHIRDSINDVDFYISAMIVAEGARQDVFALLHPVATRVLAAAVSLELPGAAVVHVREIVRKIRGNRAKPIPPVPPVNGDEPHKYISVSQVSFDEQIEHLNQLINVVMLQTKYTPAEHDITVDGLNELRDAMGVANDAAKSATRDLAESRERRNELLYTPTTGMMDTGILVKEYVKSAYGLKSPQYKEVKGIRFANKKPKNI
ncbi:MAG: hypothetical protein LBF79_01940 [Dysgonamonadaceae bacterium]|nr:hypothetical protein [Dysgonamonadaceae bacterium]